MEIYQISINIQGRWDDEVDGVSWQILTPIAVTTLADDPVIQFHLEQFKDWSMKKKKRLPDKYCMNLQFGIRE